MSFEGKDLTHRIVDPASEAFHITLCRQSMKFHNVKVLSWHVLYQIILDKLIAVAVATHCKWILECSAFSVYLEYPFVCLSRVSLLAGRVSRPQWA